MSGSAINPEMSKEAWAAKLEASRNEQLDDHLESLATSFEELVASAKMGEKTTSVIDQEGYLGESNSAAIVHGVEGIMSMVTSLKHSLLMNDVKGTEDSTQQRVQSLQALRTRAEEEVRSFEEDMLHGLRELEGIVPFTQTSSTDP